MADTSNIENNSTNQPDPYGYGEEDWGNENPEATEAASEDGFGQEGDSFQMGDVTQEQIKDLKTKVISTKFSPEKQKEILDILDQALRFEVAHKDEESAKKFMEASESFNEAGQESEEDAGNNPTPTREERGVKYYEQGEPNQAFQFVPEEGTHVVEKLDGATVTITPEYKANVEVAKDGKYYIVTVTKEDGKKCIYKIEREKVKQVYIASDKVTGDEISNSKGKIVVGATEGKTFVSGAKIDEVSQKLQNSVNKIGAMQYKPVAAGPNGNNGNALPVKPDKPYVVGYLGARPYKYASDAAVAAQRVKETQEILKLMGQASQETDPARKKEAWAKAIDTMGRYKTQGESEGRINDLGQAVFNVLYGEFGEEGLKYAFKNGIIPAEFGKKLGELLRAKPDENTKLSDSTNYNHGGPGFSHETSAVWLDSYAKEGEGSMDAAVV